MPLEDVSNDSQMIDWLRQSGHGHLLDERIDNTRSSSAPPSPPSQRPPPPPPPAASIPFGQTTSSSNYPPQTTTLSSVSPIFNAGFGGAFGDPPPSTLNRSRSFNQPDYHTTAGYGGPGGTVGATSSPLPIGPSPFGQQSSPLHFSASPTQMLGSNMNQQQLDVDIENMKRDPNTRVVQRPPQEDVVYKQRVFVRYLQPPTPPVGGTIIVREKQQTPPPPEPPIVIKRAPPPPPTPPPVTIRERPPPLPPPEGTTVIDKIVPPGPKPPRQVIIEQYPPLPPKPQDVIIERWLPLQPRQRRILYERLPPINPPPVRPIVVQYGQPQVRVQREVVVAPPNAQPPFQQMPGRTDVNQILSQIGGTQPFSSTASPSSLFAYNPYSTIQPNYSSMSHPQSNVVIMQNGQPTSLSSAPYGIPMTCVCTPNPTAGLNIYGSGISTIPTSGQGPGQTMVYNVPDNVPIDSILRQLGIDPYSIQRTDGSPLQNPSSAVSHVWNAASHGTEFNRPPSPALRRAWDEMEHYLQGQNNAVRSVWGHIHPQNTSYPQSNYPPPIPPRYSPSPSTNYPPPPPNYPPPQPNYPPPQPNYPPPQPNYPPPPPANYPPRSPTNYPPPQSSYPPPPSNYPPPSPGSYPPPPPSSYPPPGGSTGAGSSVIARLFGGGR